MRIAAAMRSQRERTPSGGGADTAIELASAVDGPGDHLDSDDLGADTALADKTKGRHDLGIRKDHADIVGRPRSRATSFASVARRRARRKS